MLLADENTKNGSQFPRLDSKGTPSNTSLVLLLNCMGVLDEVMLYTLMFCDTQSWKQRLNSLFCLEVIRNHT
jgi:hypothetical protein